MQLNNINGWIFIDKPKGLTSYGVVNVIKKLLPRKYKIGHGGTLDPLAEGVLPIALGEATKTVQFVMNKAKTYSFTITFGQATSTGDSEGEVMATSSYMPSEQEIIDILPSFIGQIKQIPPQYSAIKINGQRAYKLAREGKNVQMPSREVTIYDLKLINYSYANKQVAFLAKVGKGTYIRSLGIDIAEKLKAAGYISYLRREAFDSSKSLRLADLNKLCTIEGYCANVVHSIEDMLDDILAYPVTFDQTKNILQGNLKGLPLNMDLRPGLVKALYDNKIVSVLKYDGSGLKIIKVFNRNI